jgi:hypothetical protein
MGALVDVQVDRLQEYKADADAASLDAHAANGGVDVMHRAVLFNKWLCSKGASYCTSMSIANYFLVVV